MVGCEEAVVVGGTAAAVAVGAAADVPVGTADAVDKGLTNAAAVFDHFRVPAAVDAAFHHSPRNRQTHYVGRRSPPAALPKATDSERVRIAQGRRGGNVRLHYLLYLAIGICIANKVLYSHSRVFSWVCVDDRFLYDVFIRKLSDDYLDNFLLRFCDPHPTHHAHELIDARKKCFRVFVGVHCNVLQLLDKEGC